MHAGDNWTDGKRVPSQQDALFALTTSWPHDVITIGDSGHLLHICIEHFEYSHHGNKHNCSRYSLCSHAYLMRPVALTSMWFQFSAVVMSKGQNRPNLLQYVICTFWTLQEVLSGILGSFVHHQFIHDSERKSHRGLAQKKKTEN